MDSKTLPAQVENWIGEMRHVASEQPGTGACAVASAMDLWLWTVQHVQNSDDDHDPSCKQHDLQLLTDALCLLLSARSMVFGSWEKGAGDAPGATSSESSEGLEAFYTDLCHAQSARSAGEVGRICAEIVFGRRLHPTWDPGCTACIPADDIDALEGIMPGISYGARLTGNVLESDGAHDEKAGPCVQLGELQGFINRRTKLDGCLSGAHLSKTRAAQRLTGLIS